MTQHRITLEPYPYPEPYDMLRSYPSPAPTLRPISHHPYPEPHSYITLTLSSEEVDDSRSNEGESTDEGVNDNDEVE